MKKKANYQYFVEGKDEKSLLDTLKSDLRCIESGKVDTFNVIQNQFTEARIRTMRQNTIVVLVYDTDVEKTDVLRHNIFFLNQHNAVKDVLCIPQVYNLEDELLYACQLKTVGELTRSSSTKDFKRDLISCRNLSERLKICHFDISKFWGRLPKNQFTAWGNDANKIKIKSK